MRARIQLDIIELAEVENVTKTDVHRRHGRLEWVVGLVQLYFIIWGICNTGYRFFLFSTWLIVVKQVSHYESIHTGGII